jgi:hypothetical protein
MSMARATHSAMVERIQLGGDGLRRARIACPAEAVPAPGQYVQADAPHDDHAILPISLFSGGSVEDGFISGGAIPDQWTPGTPLLLRGPLGRGFQIPQAARHIALVGLDAHVGRLAGLWRDAAREIALFSDAPFPELPAGVEANPLNAFPDARGWADHIAIDVPLAQLDTLAGIVGLDATRPLPTSTEALVHTAMPCGALAACGVCAVHTRGKPRWAYACEAGPVFPLSELLT